MLSIYAPIDFHTELQELIQKEDRLEELITIYDFLKVRPEPSAHSVIIKGGLIGFPLDWYNLQAPFLLPESIELTPNNLLGILFAQLGNYEKSYEYLHKDNPSLFVELDFLNRLQQGLSINPDELTAKYSPYEEYRLMHNQAIVRHYASTQEEFDLEKTIYFYGEAFQAAPSEEHRAFTARQFALLFIDLNQPERASRIMMAVDNLDLNVDARNEVHQVLCQAWLQELQSPYDQVLLEKLKKTLWNVLQVYEKQGRKREAALLYIDAGIIANYSESWSESLGYFNKAIGIFEEEELPELAANAQYRKGILLFTWAKNGNPQFLRTAAETFQHAVKVFTREASPAVYADIQHHMGMIYAEIPDEKKKKSIWAAVSSSAFQEALQIYTKEAYPYEYATVCNHYGNALTKYPVAKLSDNTEKALFYYQEALALRDAEKFPMERSLTLLNYLEAQWNLGMPEDNFDEKRYLDMVDKAEEVLALGQEEPLLITAREHLEKLSYLKTAYA